MQKSEAKKIVATLAANYAPQLARLGIEQVRQMAEICADMLQDLEFDVVKAAAERLMASSEFMPTIAAIRSAALSITDGPQRPGGDAWGDVLKAVSRFGIYRTPSFDDPVVARCVRQLGWTEVCNSTNRPADRARFIELYDQLKSHERVDKLTGHLPAQTRLRELRAQATAFETPDASNLVLVQFIGESLARRGGRLS